MRTTIKEQDTPASTKHVINECAWTASDGLHTVTYMCRGVVVQPVRVSFHYVYLLDGQHRIQSVYIDSSGATIQLTAVGEPVPDEEVRCTDMRFA
jgi:hypothetical protein